MIYIIFGTVRAVNERIGTSITRFINHGELDVTLVTPGGVPRVFDEQVVQASGFINAIPDSEYAVVYTVKHMVLVLIKIYVHAIQSINDTA